MLPLELTGDCRTIVAPSKSSFITETDGVRLSFSEAHPAITNAVNRAMNLILPPCRSWWRLTAQGLTHKGTLLYGCFRVKSLLAVASSARTRCSRITECPCE